jgi:hypothetical protein
MGCLIIVLNNLDVVKSGGCQFDLINNWIYHRQRKVLLVKAIGYGRSMWLFGQIDYRPISLQALLIRERCRLQWGRVEQDCCSGDHLESKVSILLSIEGPMRGT